MPTLTLVAAPSEGATARDDVTGAIFRQGIPTLVDDPTVWERLQSLEPLGYRFEVGDNVVTADSAAVANPPAEQAADTPTAQES